MHANGNAPPQACLDNRLPPILAPIPDAIPAALRAIPQAWCVWSAVPSRKPGKIDKRPKRHDDVSAGLSTEGPEGWGSFRDAMRGYRYPSHRLAYGGGIGLRLTGLFDLIVIDLDRVVGAAGEVSPWAQEIVNRAQTYTELSPSGTGLHIFARGARPFDQTKPIEVYAGHSARFITVTGHRLPGTPGDGRDAT